MLGKLQHRLPGGNTRNRDVRGVNNWGWRDDNRVPPPTINNNNICLISLKLFKLKFSLPRIQTETRRTYRSFFEKNN